MAVGAIAKQNVANKLAQVFGSDWIGEVDKKYYLWADDGGTKVQIAITMTHPKVDVEAGDAAPAPKGDVGLDFEKMAPDPQDYKPATISDSEKQAVADLMARLGL